MKRFLKIAGIATGCLVLLIVGWLAVNLLFFNEEGYREGRQYFGDLKGIEYDFRKGLHGKTTYTAISLDDLVKQQIIGQDTCDLIKAYNGRFTPFTASSPEDMVVLRFDNYLFEPDIFTKRDLTADQQAPDHFVDEK